MADETEEDLHAAMRNFGKAWFESDREGLNSLLSKTYTHSDGNGGRSNRDSFMQIVASLKGRLMGLAFRDVEMRLIDGVGVITGYTFVRMAAGPGRREEGARMTFTQVWLLRDDQWQIEAYHATPAPPSKAERIEISEIKA